MNLEGNRMGSPEGVPTAERSSYEKLRPGPGRTREEVRSHQKERLRNALIELVAESGFAGLTVRALSRTSGVSTRTFYAHFPNLEECFACTYGAIVREMRARLVFHALCAHDGEDALGGQLRALFATVAHNTAAAKLALFDALDGGPAMQRQAEATTAVLEAQLSESLDPSSRPSAPPITAAVEFALRTRATGLAGDDAVEDLLEWIHEVGAGLGSHLESSTQEFERQRPVSLRDDPTFKAVQAVGGDRGRILAALAKVGAKQEYWALSATQIRREAGVAARTFDRLYCSLSDCYIDCSEVLVTAVVGRADAVLSPNLDWRRRIELMAEVLSMEVRRSPLLVGRFGFVEALRPGAPAIRRRDRLVVAMARTQRERLSTRERPPEMMIALSWSAAFGTIDSTAKQASLAAAGRSARQAELPPSRRDSTPFRAS
jgi:AcrR family transcriptional regulator